MTDLRFVYVARPIDSVDRFREDSTLLELLHADALDALKARGIGSYDPYNAWHAPIGVPVGPEIRHANLIAQGRCQAVLAILPDDIPSAGVPIEIERATTQWQQPVAILGGQPGWALPPIAGARQYFGRDATAAVEWLIAQPVPEIPRREPLAVQLVSPDGRLPTKAYPDDAGYDLYVSERTVVPSGQFRDVPCGIAVQLPAHCWAMIVGRSSTLRIRGLLVQTGVIDAGWRGQLFAAVQSLGGPPEVIEVGDRVAQLLIFDNTSMRLGAPMRVDALEPHRRGTNGFGSSGQ